MLSPCAPGIFVVPSLPVVAIQVERHMQSLPIERRKWFVLLIGVVGIGAACVCLLVVRSSLPSEAGNAHIALTLLFVGAMSGFVTVLNLLLPLLLVKVWPGLEASRPQQ